MAGKFHELDMYDLNGLLTDEERMVRDSVRDFVDRDVLPTIEAHHTAGTFPTEKLKTLGELGLYGPSLKGYGCPGLSNVSYGVAMMELERGDSGFRSAASVQGSLVMYPIWQYGSEEQKNKYLPKLASGELIGCFGLTEPDHGSNPGGMITRARRTADGWLLTGAKMWITNSPIADLAIVWAKVEEDGKDAIRGFIVEASTPGYSAPEIKGKWSLRASLTGELVFEDCHLPADAMLANSPANLKGPLSCLTQARYGIAWGAIGAAQACFDSAVHYSREREQFGKPIGAFQLTQKKLAEAAVEITKAQMLAWRLGRLKDAGTMTPIQVSVAKLNNVGIACDIASVMREIHGAMGITDEYPIMRHIMNLESVKTYEGTNDIHTLAIGREVTGLNAFF
ncbi:MAG: acyl-CoA dehydrogenase family protein [Deltaproteobacteria bacterium]|nr:acyl-CoA dehydrogenase family protein [Deltaproteobacteria bacterium]